jgi:hypothetical protein
VMFGNASSSCASCRTMATPKNTHNPKIKKKTWRQWKGLMK